MGTTIEAVGLGILMCVFYNKKDTAQRTSQIL